MDCRIFQRKHDAFFDDTLPGIEMASLRDHLARCAHCARRDADLRRALLLVRNLPTVQVAADFESRLRDRIQREAAEEPAPEGKRVTMAVVRGAAAALVLIAVAVGGLEFRGTPTGVPVLDPAFVTYSPPLFAHDDPAAAFVASMSTGIPMWPALMLAEEGPLLFATTGLQAAYPREP